MSHIISNIDSVMKINAREYQDSEVAVMTTEQFDKLPLCDQISIYHNFPNEYNRLTGRTAPKAEDTRTDAQKAIDAFEKRVDEAIRRVFHPNGA